MPRRSRKRARRERGGATRLPPAELGHTYTVCSPASKVLLLGPAPRVFVVRFAGAASTEAVFRGGRENRRRGGRRADEIHAVLAPFYHRGRLPTPMARALRPRARDGRVFFCLLAVHLRRNLSGVKKKLDEILLWSFVRTVGSFVVHNSCAW